MKVESSVARDLRIIEGKEKYDTQVKTLLANKEVLARILKHVVSEFGELSIEYIRDECIENPYVGVVNVNPGETNSKISGKTNENAVVGEGSAIFDVIFDAFLPGEEGKIKIIINIEAQKDSDAGYEIVTRALFYCARMISSQKGTEFVNSDYDGIKKVYSIWICTEPYSKDKNAIVEFAVEKKSILGNVDIPKDAYDKLDVIILYLTKDYKEESDYIIELLSTMLTKKLTADEKIKLLDEHYMPMTTELKEDIIVMCNLGEGIYEDGRQEGELSTLIKLVNEQLLSIHDAAKCAGISEDEFAKYLEK